MPKAQRYGKGKKEEEREESGNPYQSKDKNIPEEVERVFKKNGGYFAVREKFLEHGKKVAQENMRKQARRLAKKGVVVLTLLTPELFEIACEVMRAEIASYPEFKQGATRLVSGSFGGLGNPSSFHSMMVRILRAMVATAVRPLFVLFAKRRGYTLSECFLQQLFDRIVMRTEGDKIPSEQWHRDTANQQVRVPKALCPPYASAENDIREKEPVPSNVGQLFGGWLNLNTNNQCQYFSCVLGTHSDEEYGNGFDKVSKEEIASLPRDKFCKVRIRPGQLMLFRQNLIHEVCAYTVGRGELRQHFAFNLSTKGCQPMFGMDYLTNVFNRQRAALLPSGQLPPMYSQNDLSFRTDKLAAWSQQTLKDEFLHDTQFGRTSKRAGERYTKCHRFIMELHQPFWPTYTKQDILAMQPVSLSDDE